MHFPERLIDGYRNFRENRFPNENHRFHLLAKAGQRPKVMLIGCCDSRAAPEVIFDAAPGEIFVVRNVANLVPPYEPDTHYHGTSAALEFAVNSLGIAHIVVMGHGKCGGIQAALNPASVETSDFIANWMSIAEDTAEVVRKMDLPDEDKQTELEHRGVQLSLRNLMTFPWVQSAIEKGDLSLHGAWFDISKGELHILDYATGEFINI